MRNVWNVYNLRYLQMMTYAPALRFLVTAAQQTRRKAI